MVRAKALRSLTFLQSPPSPWTVRPRRSDKPRNPKVFFSYLTNLTKATQSMITIDNTDNTDTLICRTLEIILYVRVV